MTDSERLERHRKLHNLGLPPLPDERKEAMLDAANLVAEALTACEAIQGTTHMGYADYPSNPKRHWGDKRPYTLKDARHDAQRAANQLRQAWQLLDPCSGVRLTPVDVSRLVNSPAIRAALVELGWKPPGS